MDKDQIFGILSSFYLFNDLTDAWLEKIADNCQLQEFSKSRIIFGRDDFPHGFYILAQGQLKLAVTSPYGVEKVIDIISPGDSFGEAALFLESKFPVCIETTIDAQILMVPRDIIINLLENDALIAQKMLKKLSIHNHQLINNIEILSLQSCTQRFIGYLLQMSTDLSGTENLKLPTNKRILASLLNLSPETLSRTINKLEAASLIKVKGKNVTLIDVAELRKFGNSELRFHSFQLR